MNELKGKYIYSNDYKVRYANGVFGGVGSRGEIFIRFFCEEVLPNEEFDINAATSENKIIREFNSGIIMNLEGAKSFYDWLGNQIAQTEKFIKNDNTKVKKCDNHDE